MVAREQAGREGSPTTAIIDSQSIRTTEAGGPRGFDAGKKVDGRKRHLLTDTLGLDLRLTWPQPKACQGLRAADRHHKRHGRPRHHPTAHAQAGKPLINNQNVSDGLSEGDRAIEIGKSSQRSRPTRRAGWMHGGAHKARCRLAPILDHQTAAG
jgi:hypothetical protein